MTREIFLITTSNMEIESYIEISEKVANIVQGLYHLESDGYYRGDATEEDVLADAEELGVWAGRDFEEVLEDVLEKLNDMFIELAEKKEGCLE